MTDISPSELRLLQAILDFENRPLASDALLQKAREMGWVIQPFNWTRSTYHGHILGQDDESWLVMVSSKSAGVLPFCEIEEGGVIPRFGDHIRLEFRGGSLKIDVTICPKNARLAAEKLGRNV